MTDMNHIQDCERIDELLEAFLDGELEVTEAMAVERHVAGCRQCGESLSLAQRIRDTLRSAGMPACPDELTPAIETLASRPRPSAGNWRHALAAGLAALAIGAAVAWQQPWRGNPDPSAAELAQARQELRVALGYIAEAGQLAGRDVGTVVTGAGMNSIRDGLRHGVNPRPGGSEDQDRSGTEGKS